MKAAVIKSTATKSMASKKPEIIRDTKERTLRRKMAAEEAVEAV